MQTRIGIDIGGTFTDLVFMGSAGQVPGSLGSRYLKSSANLLRSIAMG